MSKNSNLIFRGQQHRLTAPFHEVRTEGRLHEGTDYGTYGAAAIQYCPLDDGVVYRVITTEQNGNARGLYVDIRWQEHNIGIIFQHATKVFVKANQVVKEGDPIVSTGMTGKDRKGNRVSTGIHAHIEIYRISTEQRLDFERFDFGGLNMTEEQVRKIVKELLTGNDTAVPSWAVKEYAEAQSLGFTDGTRPGGYTTRCEAVVMNWRAYKAGLDAARK